MAIFGFVQSIAFNTFSTLSIICKSDVFLFSVIFILEDFRIYISTTYSSNMPFYIEVLINQELGKYVTLKVLYVNPNNGHIRLR